MVICTNSGVTITNCSNILIASDGNIYSQRTNASMWQQNHQLQLSVKRRGTWNNRRTVRWTKVLRKTDEVAQEAEEIKNINTLPSDTK